MLDLYPTFSIARLPRIEFGAGGVTKLPQLIRRFGKRALLVTGARSLQIGPHWQALLDGLDAAGVAWLQVTVADEPSPQLIDETVARFERSRIDVVVGIGGGSVLDAAKALAGLLRVGDSVMDYLEGVGPEKPYRGPATPFIAVPTTAGTGSEATKNAVLSVRGEQGFKKSFRDERLVPEYAVIDPDLLAGCPRPQIAANAMDALTQLLEAYTSLRANPFTDALCEQGLRAIREGLLAWYDNTPDAARGRERLAFAALASGICLAQTGLGAVHGLASPLGAFFPIPHGVACGTLVAAATEVNVQALQNREPDNPALAKYAKAAELLTRVTDADPGPAYARLLATLTDWTGHLELPRLGAYDVTQADLPRIVANSRGSSMKTNPVVLNDEEITATLRQRL